MRQNKIAAMCMAVLIFTGGCGRAQTMPSGREVPGTETATEQGEMGQKESEMVISGEIEGESVSEREEPEEILYFVDVFGQEYETEIRPNVAKHPYRLDCFLWENGTLSYQGDEHYSYRLGVDVSHHQGAIDWQKVKKQGYEFAFLRIGYRGYGMEGRVCPDRMFEENIKGAHEAGLDVGVYFFAQAVNEEEALEEAVFVLERLKGYELELPVVYDPESILDDSARTDDVSGEQFTKNTKVFCEEIKKKGYTPMIYSNMLWEAFQFDLEELAGYPVWYADYEPKPQTPYDFLS